MSSDLQDQLPVRSRVGRAAGGVAHPDRARGWLQQDVGVLDLAAALALIATTGAAAARASATPAHCHRDLSLARKVSLAGEILGLDDHALALAFRQTAHDVRRARSRFARALHNDLPARFAHFCLGRALRNAILSREVRHV